MNHDDPLDNLAADRVSPPKAELRALILAATSRIVRRRRIRRRLAYSALLAACVLFLLWFDWEKRPPPTRTTPVDKEVLVATATAPEPELDVRIHPITGLDLEWRAYDTLDNQLNRIDRYFYAGDRYLEEQDFESALRCYSRAFDAGASVEFDVDDNWLVMAVKFDRRKGREYARNEESKDESN